MKRSLNILLALFLVISFSVNGISEVSDDTNEIDSERILELDENFGEGYAHSCIISLRVFDYYKDLTKYNTPLKKSVFKESSEYRKLLSKLKKLKKRIKSRTFNIVHYGYVLSDYDLKTKKFTAYPDRDVDFSYSSYYYYFYNIPLRKKYYFDFRTYRKQAIKIEENKYDVQIVLNFKILKGYKKYEYSRQYAYSKVLSYSLVNKQTGEVYYKRKLKK